MATRLAAPLPSVMGAGVALAEVEALGLVCAFWEVWEPQAVSARAATAPSAPARVRKKLTGHVHAPRLT